MQTTKNKKEALATSWKETHN